MLRVRPFKAGDLLDLEYQGKQLLEREGMLSWGAAMYRELEGVHSSTYLDKDGKPIVCAGVIPLSRGRYEAWAIFEEGNSQSFTGIVRAIKHHISSYKGCRIQAAVQAEFAQAHRLMRMLGFALEANLMVDYFGRGLHGALYAKVID